MISVRTLRDGVKLYVLVSLHEDRHSAMNAAADIEQRTGSTPWVRTIAGLQKLATQ